MVTKFIARALRGERPISKPRTPEVTLAIAEASDFAAMKPRPIRTTSRMRPGRALTADMRSEEPSMIDVTPILDRVIAPWEMTRR